MNINTAERVVSDARSKALRVAYARLRNRDKAEDAVATATYRFINHLVRHLDNDLDLEGGRNYFFAILKRVIITPEPGEKNSNTPFHEEVAPDNRLVNYSELRIIAEAIKQLHPSTQELIRCCAAEWSLKKMADHFKTSVPYIRNKVDRIRALLASWINEGEEIEADQAPRILPPQTEDYRTIYQISLEVRRSHKYIKTHVEELVHLYSIPTARQRDRAGNERLVYHHSISTAFLLEIIRYPIADEGLVTANQIAKSCRRWLQWTQLCLERLDCPYVLRRNPRDNSLCRYYTKGCLEKVRTEAKRYKKANGWLTVNTIAKKKGWIKQRAKKEVALLGTEGQERVDAQGVLRMHYPPSVLRKLPD